jgi:hypothetical protein
LPAIDIIESHNVIVAEIAAAWTSTSSNGILPGIGKAVNAERFRLG